MTLCRSNPPPCNGGGGPRSGGGGEVLQGESARTRRREPAEAHAKSRPLHRFAVPLPRLSREDLGLLALVLALLALIPAPAAASAAPVGFDRAWAEAAAAWRADLTRERVVGGSLWFAERGKVLKREYAGLADLETNRPVDADTIYHWASITKPFTGVAILQLRDRGLIGLDDPMVKYLPELKAIHDPFGPIEQVTIRHLLTHSAGFRSPTWPWGGDKPWHAHEPSSWSQIAAMAPYTEVEFAPGSRYSYSNPGISFLGRIVEVVSREPYEAYVDKNILRPLGMDRSYFDANPPFLEGDRSNNYTIDKDGKLTANGLELDTGATVANGGLNAPIADMMRFADFLLGVGDKAHHDIVLKRASVEEMFVPAYLTNDSQPGLREHMGLTWFLEDDIQNSPEAPVRYIGHTGSQKGFLAFLYVEPRSKTAAIAAWNTASPTPRPMVYAARRKLFDRVFPLFPPR